MFACLRDQQQQLAGASGVVAEVSQPHQPTSYPSHTLFPHHLYPCTQQQRTEAAIENAAASASDALQDASDAATALVQDAANVTSGLVSDAADAAEATVTAAAQTASNIVSDAADATTAFVDDAEAAWRSAADSVRAAATPGGRVVGGCWSDSRVCLLA